MRIEIEGAAYGGYGVGRLDGKVCFVDYAFPGDILDIVMTKDAGTHCFAGINEIISSSDQRELSPCPLSGRCGGCSYLDIGYKYELELKKKILTDQLRRIAGIDELSLPRIDIIFGNRLGYRSHSVIRNNASSFGFYRRQSNDLVPFPDRGCMILSEVLKRGIGKLRPEKCGSEIRVMRDRDDNFFHAPTDSDLEVEETAGGIVFQRNINGFFQANMLLRESMLERVREYFEPEKNDCFADIGCGCGFFALNLASSAGSGWGFDSDKTSVQYARKNAEINGIENIRFFRSSFSDILPHRTEFNKVVVDPPRAGISKKGRKTINAMNPDLIVYVSCNPSTFSRDIKDFIGNGYLPDKITLIDMFPGTHHIEVISRLTKCGRKELC